VYNLLVISNSHSTNNSTNNFQVSGPRSGERRLSTDIVDKEDGGIQASAAGPDQLLHLAEIPHVDGDFSNRVDNSWLCKLCTCKTKSFKAVGSARSSRSRKKKKNQSPKNPSIDKRPNKTLDKNAEHVFFIRHTQGALLDASKKAFAVPYASPEQKGRFAQFSKKNELKSFLSASERTVEEHDRLLAQMSSTQLLHIDLSEVGVGVRLVLVNQQAFDVTFPDVDQGKVTFRNGAVHEYHAVPIPHGHSIGEYRAVVCKAVKAQNIHLPVGVAIARWVPWPFLPVVTKGRADAICLALGKGFGGRPCSKCIGQNTYFGPKGNYMANATMTTGPSQVPYAQMARDYYVPGAQPQCEQFVNLIGNQAKQLMVAMDPTLTNVITTAVLGETNGLARNEDRNPSKYKIVTQGFPGQNLSFANELHSDKKDLLSADEQVKVKDIILNAKATCTEQERSSPLAAATKYLDEWIETIGALSTSTVCGYSEIVSPQFEDANRVNSFLHTGLGVSIGYSGDWAVQFYGSAHVHQTGVSVYFKDGCAHYKDAEGGSRMFAWGSGSKKRQRNSCAAR
jgi:hypothetical protein